MVSGDSSDTPTVRRVVSQFAEVIAEGSGCLEGYGQLARGPVEIERIVRPILEREPAEVFLSVLLNAKHFVQGIAEVSRGTLTSSLVHPREVFGSAVRLCAAAIVVAHNHPSGDPEPSAEDLVVTKRLVESGKLLGIPLLDHLIVGTDGRFVSLRQRGSI